MCQPNPHIYGRRRKIRRERAEREKRIRDEKGQIENEVKRGKSAALAEERLIFPIFQGKLWTIRLRKMRKLLLPDSRSRPE